MSAPLIAEPDLRQSLRRLGPVLPVFVGPTGEIIDGRRRKQICRELRIKIEVRKVTAEQGRHLLWVLHPERALDLYANGRSLSDLAELLGARPAEVAIYLRARRPKQRPANVGWTRRSVAKLGRLQRYLDRVDQGLEPLTSQRIRDWLSPEKENT